MWAFLPALLGALASVLAQSFFQPVPLLLFKIDIGMLAFILGCLVSLLLAGIIGADTRSRTAARRKLLESLRERDLSQRRFLRRLDHEIKNPLTGLQAALANVREFWIGRGTHACGRECRTRGGTPDPAADRSAKTG